MNKSYQVLAMTIGTAITLVQPQAVWALEAADVNAIAEEITVRISGSGSNGTGVIIAKKGNTYYVLTAYHVVSQQDIYKIKTDDDREYSVHYSTLRRLPGVDLALLEFTSRTKYRVAEIGDSERLTVGSTLYIAGWPAPGATISERIYQFTEGKISARRSSSLEGYTLIYTNITRKGMSGGPVLNDRGQLIAIHGKAEGDRLYTESGIQIIKAGFNLGIPIQTFIDSSYGEGLRIGKRNDNYNPPRIYPSPPSLPPPVTAEWPPENTEREPPEQGVQLREHIVLIDSSWQLTQDEIQDDIDKINLVLSYKDLRPAACNQSAALVRVRMGPYEACAYPNPRNNHPAGNYEFPFWK